MLELRHCVLDTSQKGSSNECEVALFVICLLIFVKISLFLLVSESDLATQLN